MKKIKICIFIIFLAKLHLFARHDFDTVRTFKYGLKLSGRVGTYSNIQDIVERTIILPGFIWFKNNGNYTEIEPLNFATNSRTIGNQYTADSINYSSTIQAQYVPKLKFFYKIYQHKNNRIFIGMTHTLRYAAKNIAYKGYNRVNSYRFDYAFGIDLTFQKSLSDRFILDVSISSYLLKISLETERKTVNTYDSDVTYTPSLNKFYENDYSSFISTPVSIQIGLIYSFKKIVK